MAVNTSRVTTCRPSSALLDGEHRNRAAADPAEHRELQKRIASEALRTDAAQLPLPDRAHDRAVTAILDASIDQAILSRSHIVTILSRFEAAMRRWRCDDSSMKQPIRWPVTAEREVQDILWLMLRPVFEDLVEEETLPRLGHSTYRADFGIPSLGILIEVKYVRKSSDFKEIEKQVLEDSVAYLNGVSAYKRDHRLHLRRVSLSPRARHHSQLAARYRPHQRRHHRVQAQPGRKARSSPSARGYSQTFASNRTQVAPLHRTAHWPRRNGDGGNTPVPPAPRGLSGPPADPPLVGTRDRRARRVA